jgi:hypothetical protein
MSAPTVIQDAKSGQRATVTKFGQLVVAPVDYSTPVAKTLDVINTAYNFIEPSYQQNIVITDIILTANKNVGATDATVTLYEADEIDTTTSTNDILNLEMIKQSNLVLTGLNMLVSEGKFVNAKTDDDDVFVTIMYYKVPVEAI